jgi:Zn-finger nucleic acid-binding protein
MKVETLRERHADLEIDRCPSCDGIWLDQSEMQKLEAIVEPVFLEIRKIPAKIDQLLGLYCPRCEGRVLMEKADHDRDEKVVVDYCPNCKGVWLDKGELRAIQQENIFVAIYHLLRDL